MRSLIAIFVGALIASVAAAETVTLRTLSGKTEEGDLIGLSPQEITLRGKNGNFSAAVNDTLDIAIPGNTPSPTDSAYGDLELIDGTILHCSQFAARKDQAEVKLLSGLEAKLPLKIVSSYLNDAQDAHVRDEWQGFLAKRGNSDLLGVRDVSGKVNVLEGTFGQGDDTGQGIAFESTAGVSRQLGLNRIHAMAFVRRLEGDAPATLCKIHDAFRDVVVAAKVDLEANHLQVVTVAGAHLDVPLANVLRLDYSQGKLTYLSDLEPVKVVETSNVDRVDHYRRDKNLDDKPLTLVTATGTRRESRTFAKGLAVHATTELVYDIAGQYKELKSLLGVDPTVGGESRVRVSIEGDGRELLNVEMARADAARPISCNVQGVRRLRILVQPVGVLDLSNHINFVEARVSK